MSIIGNSRTFLLFLGDLVFLYVSLWLALFLRYLKLPSMDIWQSHFAPFTILFGIFILIFYIVGFYEKKIIFAKKILFSNILQIYLINIFIATSFFYFINYFSITPKTNLFIFLGVSFVLFFYWRSFINKIIFSREKDNSLIIYRGATLKEVTEEINKNQYGLNIVEAVDLDYFDELKVDQKIIRYVKEHNIKYVFIDSHDPTISSTTDQFYDLIFEDVQFIDFIEFYEFIFGRVPVDSIRKNWFLENIKLKPHAMYDGVKRIIDLVLASLLFILSTPFYVIVYLLIKFDDKGKIFYFDERLGKNGQKIKIIKFRSMKEGKSETRIGKLFRRSRLDELPQLINVIKGELSLVGPRPEKPNLIEEYKQKIPYYESRLLIKPGLSGWAQIYHENHPHHGVYIEATKEKLSYDLYYIKNRSFWLDLKIALKTIKTLFLTKGK